MNLTNQELIQELEKRIKTGTIKAEVIADRVEEQTNSLFTTLKGKDLLLLLILTTAFGLAICYSIKTTTTKIVEVSIEFDQHPPVKISPLINGEC